MPASSAAVATSACIDDGRTIEIASMSPRAMRLCQSSWRAISAAAAPTTSLKRAPSGSAIATTRTPSSRLQTLKWFPPIRPSPTMPIRRSVMPPNLREGTPRSLPCSLCVPVEACARRCARWRGRHRRSRGGRSAAAPRARRRTGPGRRRRAWFQPRSTVSVHSVSSRSVMHGTPHRWPRAARRRSRSRWPARRVPG